MVAFLSVVALLSFCTLSRYFQTIPGSCLQTILGMEKRKAFKAQEGEPNSDQVQPEPPGS